MARLPDPGQDAGDWGEILNEYLRVAHTEGGGLRSTGGVLVAASDATEASRGAAAYVCDGVADEEEIQAALDSLPDDGGRVVLSEGTFEIASTIHIDRDGVTLEGLSIGERGDAVTDGLGTRLAATASLTGEILLVQHRDDARPSVGIILRDLSLDGRSDDLGGASPIDGVHFRSHEGGLHNVRVHKCSGSGIRIHGYPNWDTYDTQLIGCMSRFSGEHSIYLDDDSPDLHLIGCILAFSGLDNLLIRSGSQQIMNCHMYAAGRHNIHFDNAGSRSKILGCKIENAVENGLLINANDDGWPGDIQVIGNGFKSNGLGADNGYDHVLIQGGGPTAAKRTTLVGNSFSWIQIGANPNRPRYGVHLDGVGAQGTLVTSNSFGPNSHFGSGQIRDASDPAEPAIVRGNLNWVTERQGTASIASGATQVVVNHGLSTTPSLANLQVTPTNSLGASSRWWISDPTATTFTLHVDTEPGDGGATFAWQAQIL